MRKIAPLFLVVLLSGCSTLGFDKVDSVGDKVALAQGTLHIAVEAINEAFDKGLVPDELMVGEIAIAIDAADEAIKIAVKNIAIIKQAGGTPDKSDDVVAYVNLAIDAVAAVSVISARYRQ